ncbi:MAG TPA: hypothetical protein VGR71_10035, partial [Nitrospira sp.]|nr:hypothetical protein [Nitrospira sp.]
YKTRSSIGVGHVRIVAGRGSDLAGFWVSEDNGSLQRMYRLKKSSAMRTLVSVLAGSVITIGPVSGAARLAALLTDYHRHSLPSAGSPCATRMSI